MRRIIPVMRASGQAIDCPLAPPARETTQARTLHRACLVLGGLAQLARHLQVAEPALRDWLSGRESPPEAVFLAAVEILLLHLEAPRQAS